MNDDAKIKTSTCHKIINMVYSSYVDNVGKRLPIQVKKYFITYKYWINIKKKNHESSTYLFYSAFHHSQIFKTSAAPCTL